MSVTYILYLSIISGFFPVISALYNYRNLDKTLKIVAGFLLISVLFDSGFEIASHYHVTNNFPAIHLFIVLTLVFFAAIYYTAFFSPLLKKATLILSILAFMLLIFNLIFNEGIWEYPSMSNTVLSVLLIFFSLVYFYQILTRQEFIHIEKQGLFWINAGVLFYYSVNIFLFMLFRRIINSHQEDYYIIHNVTNIIANVLFTVGILCKPQLQKTT
ncbi:hypothetical protein [Mucilaginibacter xinganensis]|uniref:Uncharacterized protein n=1 Tax=Mucilaginibacter xinganensis TaxID=1234841 RepID=A0A223P341_9SPHI|nr:hypothetical protein [Mucilaginibacter xinganensis]ASU36525.1 hypothetical protein MuYL_4642 [Mucilaginibacter xinganensis]